MAMVAAEEAENDNGNRRGCSDGTEVELMMCLAEGFCAEGVDGSYHSIGYDYPFSDSIFSFAQLGSSVDSKFLF